jgi:hypothetical protein
MADILDDLLTAYKTDIASLQATTFSWVRMYAIPGETDLTNWYGLLPLVLILPVSTILAPDSFEGSCRSDRKVYTILLSAILQAYDQSYGTKSPNVPDMVQAIQRGQTLETRYNRNTLSLSQSCVLTNITYGPPPIPGFTVDGQGWVHAVNLTFEHDWIDRRAA